MWAIAALALVASLAAVAPARAEEPSPWQLPAEGKCERAQRPASPAEAPAAEAGDAAGLPFEPGDVVGHERVELLRDWIPPELWEHRERFFFEGMRLEIGPCFRDYSPPEYFERATRELSGQARLDDGGGLTGYKAGLPFAPEAIAPDDPEAARKWAWNWVHRYSAAGSFGSLRLSWVEMGGVIARFEGEFFWVKIDGRADRPEDGYRFPAKTKARWVSGGETENAASGETCAWRQYASGGRKPDLFFWSPGARKVVRGNAPDAEGPIGGCLVGGYRSLLLHGDEPHLHDWRLIAVRDLLAPINVRGTGYPYEEDRDFGPSGISFANDRWELRRALVLEGRLREGRFEDGTERFVWYLDLQTLAPLYYAAFDARGESAGVGLFAGRWSEDRDDYRPWPDQSERAVRLIDQVGVGLVRWSEKEAVRIESWDTVGTPPPDKAVMRNLNVSSLRGR